MLGRKTLPAAVVLVIGFFAGCGEDVERLGSPEYGNPPPTPLQDFQTAWKSKDIARYSELLADDFRFYFDPDTREIRGLPEYWNRETDVAHVGMLFASPQVKDIRLTLTYDAQPEPHASNPGWALIRVPDEYLQVELKPVEGETEGITLIVDGQLQEFSFRKGRTAADTLATSATSGRYYIVEWRDYGLVHQMTTAASEPITWGSIKARFN